MLRIAIIVLVLGLAKPTMAQSIYGGSGNQGGGYGTGSNPSSHMTQGYTRSDGGYVQPYQQTNPNSTQMDNYSTRGNVNPYTGAYGTRPPRY